MALFIIWPNPIVLLDVSGRSLGSGRGSLISSNASARGGLDYCNRVVCDDRRMCLRRTFVCAAVCAAAALFSAGLAAAQKSEKRFVIVLIGPTGSGKTTQSE